MYNLTVCESFVYVWENISTSSLSVWMPFISFSRLIALVRNSNIMNKNSETGYPYLALDLKGENTFSKSFLFLMKKWKLDFLKCFFFIYWDDYVIFVFSFVDMVYHVAWFVCVEAALWHWNEPRYGIWYMILGIWYSIWFFLCTVGFNLRNFAKNFFIYIHHRYWFVIFFFLVVSLSSFGIRVMVDS